MERVDGLENLSQQASKENARYGRDEMNLIEFPFGPIKLIGPSSGSTDRKRIFAFTSPSVLTRCTYSWDSTLVPNQIFSEISNCPDTSSKRSGRLVNT